MFKLRQLALGLSAEVEKRPGRETLPLDGVPKGLDRSLQSAWAAQSPYIWKEECCQEG